MNVEYAKTGKKAVEFQPVCKGLGLCFDLTRSASGEITICHTSERRDELRELLRQFLLLMFSVVLMLSL